jgi:undecaprenyl-diphosphatase
LKTRILIVILLLLGFLKIASEVSEGDSGSPEWITNFDTIISKFAFEYRSEELTRLALRATVLGSTTLLTIFTCIAVIALWWLQKRPRAVFLSCAGIGAAVLSPATKAIFDRHRPSEFPMLDLVTSPSYPSGHTLGATTVFFAIAFLLTEIYEDKIKKVSVLLLFGIIPILVGLSRIYLGVHFASDVIAGAMLGVAWVLICWQLFLRFTSKTSKADSTYPSEQIYPETPKV